MGSKSPRPDDEKLSLVFNMFDRDKDGNLDESEVKLLLETGLEQAGPSSGGGQAEQVIREMKDAPDSRPKWFRRGCSMEQFKGALSNEKIARAITPGGEGEGAASIS